MVTLKFDTFCQKWKELPSIRYGYGANGETCFKQWYDSLSPHSELHGRYIEEMFNFCFTGINHKHDFYQLKTEVIKEIDENIKSFINPYQFNQYFIYLNRVLKHFYRVIEIQVEDLNRINHKEYTDDEFKTLEPIKKTDFILFITFSLEIKSCLASYIDVKSYIDQQEILFGGKTVGTDNATLAIDKFSDKTAHKILLLHELGIIDYLQKEYFNSNQTVRNGTDLANLIANIIGEPTKGDTIRKNISGILSKGKDNIITKPAVIEVKKFLTKYNIPLKRLKDKD